MTSSPEETAAKARPISRSLERAARALPKERPGTVTDFRSSTEDPVDARNWSRVLTRYRAPNPVRTALEDSSHYDLPPILRWITVNIGVHHVHHPASRIPFYRLPEVLRDHGALANSNRVTLRESLSCARLALWDLSERRLVTFAEVRRLPA